MKTIIGIILFFAILAGIMYLGLTYENAISKEAYHEGICTMCGGAYRFSGSSHIKNGGDRYYYTCEDCGHTVMTYRIMK